MKKIASVIFAVGMGHSGYGVSKTELDSLLDSSHSTSDIDSYLQKIEKGAHSIIDENWCCNDNLIEDLFVRLLIASNPHGDMMRRELLNFLGMEADPQNNSAYDVKSNPEARNKLIELLQKGRGVTNKDGKPTKKQKSEVNNIIKEIQNQVVRDMFLNIGKYGLGDKEYALTCVKQLFANRTGLATRGNPYQNLLKNMESFSVESMDNHLKSESGKQCELIVVMKTILHLTSLKNLEEMKKEFQTIKHSQEQLNRLDYLEALKQKRKEKQQALEALRVIAKEPEPQDGGKRTLEKQKIFDNTIQQLATLCDGKKMTEIEKDVVRVIVENYHQQQNLEDSD